MAKKKPGPDTTSAAYDYMLPKWVKMETLLEGTDAMRGAGREYLPQHDGESDSAYAERLERTNLLNMAQMTLDAWVGKPFGDPVEVGDDVPAQVQEWLDDVDLQGNSLDVFARNWFRDGLAKAFSHVLVSFPRPPERPDGLPRTLEDDRRDNLRPYLVHVKPENLIFGFATVVNGVEKLAHVRIKEVETTMVGWEEVTTVRIRVLTPGHVEVLEQRLDPRTKKPVWVSVESYDYDLDFIPLVTFYADRQGFMIGKPPLNDLADMNIRHWQSTSDQIAVLTVARFPVLGVSGAVTDDELTIGPNKWLHCPDSAGRFYYVEHSGKAIASGRQDILDLEELMAEYGATFLKKRPGGASATARALDTAEVTSPLQDMALRFESALNEAMYYMAQWVGLPEAGKFGINVDFGLDHGKAELLAELREARKLRDISRRRYLVELKRMGALGDDFDAKEHDSELKAESLELKKAGLNPITGQPNKPNPAKKGGDKKPVAK